MSSSKNRPTGWSRGWFSKVASDRRRGPTQRPRRLQYEFLERRTLLSATVTKVAPALGPLAGGTAVTITGTGFSGATAVDFGTVAATNVAVNAGGTQITATDPSGTGTVNVTVVTPSGTSPPRAAISSATTASRR